MIYYWIFAILGRTLAYGPKFIPQTICWVIGNLIYFLYRSRRHIMLNNLHHAFPEKSESWRRHVARISCQRLVEMALFSVAATYFPKSRIAKMVWGDPEDFSSFSNNEPTVGVAAHFSLMEALTLAPSLSKQKVKEIGIIYRPLDNHSIDKLVKRSRQRFGIRLLSRKKGFFQTIDILKRNGTVGVLFDQNAGNRGILSLFLNRPSMLTDLPGLLSSKFKTRLIALKFIRESFWKVKIKPIELLPFNHNKSDLEITFIINEWLENLLKSDEKICEDWMWLHDRWRCLDYHDRRFTIYTRTNRLPETLAYKGLPSIPRTTRYWIRLPNWLGDVIMAIPLIRAIRDNRPDAEITLIGKPHFLPLLEKLNLHERFVPLPEKGIFYYFKTCSWRLEYPDVHVLLTNSFRGDLEAFLAGAHQRFGMVRPGKKRPLLTHPYHLPASIDETTIHQTHVWQRCFEYYGLPRDYPLNLSPISWPSSTNLSPTSILKIGLICSTENAPEKRWPVSHWREFITKLISVQPNIEIHLFGTSRDFDICNEVQTGFDHKYVKNLAGRTSLSEFAEALSVCHVVICNDTGGMHLANMLGRPVVAIYGPTNPIRTGPIFEASKVILQPTNCPATGGMPIDNISPQTVLNATLPFLA